MQVGTKFAPTGYAAGGYKKLVNIYIKPIILCNVNIKIFVVTKFRRLNF